MGALAAAAGAVWLWPVGTGGSEPKLLTTLSLASPHRCSLPNALSAQAFGNAHGQGERVGAPRRALAHPSRAKRSLSRQRSPSPSSAGRPPTSGGDASALQAENAKLKKEKLKEKG